MTGASEAPHAPPPAPAGRRTRTPQAELAQPAQQAAERDAHVLVSAGKAFRKRLLTLGWAGTASDAAKVPHLALRVWT